MSQSMLLCSLMQLVLSLICAIQVETMLPKGHLKRLGAHQPPQGKVEELHEMPRANVFYHTYVVKSRPVILKGAATKSDAFTLWTDHYLSENFGDVEVHVDYGKKENRERAADVMTFRDFLNIYNSTNRYLIDSLPQALKKDFQLPQCILCGGFTKRLQDSVLWFSSGGTNSFLHVDNVENINCLLSGQKDWFFVDKENSEMINLDHGEGEYCGVDVETVDMIKYPSLENIPWWSAHIEAGDCIYVPYGWAHQVRSYSRNIAVNIWWAVMTSFNSSDCNNIEKERASLSDFEYTYGEQMRFLILNLLGRNGGRLTYDIMHKMIRHEHNGQRIVTQKGFALLDQNADGILLAEEIESLNPKTIENALQRTPPGKINIRGMAQSRDTRLEAVLQKVGEQEDYIEEFLLRLHKTSHEITSFLQTHGEQLHHEIKKYLQECLHENHDEL